MTDQQRYFEAVLLRVHARMRLRPPYPLGARDVDAWLARRDPALLAEAERETARWIAILNRFAELAEALIAADLRRLAHWSYAWGFALDPVLADDPEARKQVSANLAYAGMLHPSLAAQLHEDSFALFFERLTVELAIVAPGGHDLSRVLPALRRLAEATGIDAAKARIPKAPAHADELLALHPLVWPLALPQLDVLKAISAFRLVRLGLPVAEVYPWLDAPEPLLWVWTGDLGALVAWSRRALGPSNGQGREAREALDRLAVLRAGRPISEDHDLRQARAIAAALSELRHALHVADMTREASLVAAFLAFLDGAAPEGQRHAQRGGLLPGPDTEGLRTANLPDLLGRIGFARRQRGPAGALRAVERAAGLRDAS